MKSKILLALLTILIGCFVVLMFITINNLKLSSIWFSLAMLFIGIYALVKSHLYMLDSFMYFGILNVLFAFATAYKFLSGIKLNFYYPVYFLCFAISHLAVFVKFRQNIHFKLFAILATQGILLITYKINFLSQSALIAINIAFIIFVAFNAIYRLRKNLRRE